MLLVILSLPIVAHAAPRLFFSDLTAGPKIGGENNKGAYVTVYGTGFGASQGVSTMTVGGGAVDNCPVWGATWLWYQKIVCQLGANAVTGNIVVTVGGSASNGLAFTVNDTIGIHFVATTGNNANDGSFATPYREPWYCKAFGGVGSICYIRAGTYSTVEASFPGGAGDGASCFYMSNYTGGGSIIGYPGETATVACDRAGAQSWDVRSATGAASGWTFAELDFGGTPGTNYNVAWENANGGDNLRFIGNKFHGVTGVAMVMQGPMNGVDILGNYFYDYWYLPNGANLGERGYGIYFGGYGTQQNINIGWNRLSQLQGACYGLGSTTTAGFAVVASSSYENCAFTSFAPGDHIVLGSGGNFVIDTIIDATHLTVTTDPGNQALDSTHPWVLGGDNGTKGINIYGHLAGDIINNLVINDNEVWGMCREALLAGGSDGGTPIFNATDTQYVYNNLFVGNGKCDAFFAYTAVTIQSGKWELTNNTYYANGNSPLVGESGDFLNQGLTSVIMTNEVHVAPANTVDYCGYACQEGGGNNTTQLTGSTNSFLGFGNGPAVLTGNKNATDPLFVNATLDQTTADFHLQSSSPVKDGGTTKSYASPDMDGVSRPQNTTYGLGVFEQYTGVNPTSIHFRGHH